MDNGNRNNSQGDGDEEKYGSPIDPLRLSRRMWAGKWVLLGAFAAGVLIGLPVAKFFVPKTFTATAMLRFVGVAPVDGLGSSSDAAQTVGGMIQTIYVEESLRAIGERMQMDVPTHVLGNWISADADPAQVVRIKASAPEAAEAARFANTVVDVFLERQIEAQRNRIREGITNLDTRVNGAENDLAGARATYDTFRRENAVTDLTTEQESAIESAAELRGTSGRAESDINVLEARIASLQSELRSTPAQVTGSASTSGDDLAALRQVQGELTRLRASLSDDHPRVLSLQSQAADLQARLQGGRAADPNRVAVTSSNPQHARLQMALREAQTELVAARQRLDTTARQARTAQERISQFSSIEGDATRLLGEVRVKEQLLQQLRAQKTSLEDALRNTDHGFERLSEAASPELPEASKRKYLVAGGFPIAFALIAFFYLLYRELRGFKIQTSREAAFWGKGPVIGASEWPRSPEAIDELIADMDDFVPDAIGQMLVVCANAEKASLAHEFAARLSSDWFDSTMVGSSLFKEDSSGEMGRTTLISGSPIMLVPENTSIAVTGSSELSAMRLQSTNAPQPQRPRLQVEAWEGGDVGPALRRAARLADRVCVLVVAGETSVMDVKQIKDRLGRTHGLGFVVVNVSDAFRGVPDRVGPVDSFWTATRE